VDLRSATLLVFVAKVLCSFACVDIKRTIVSTVGATCDKQDEKRLIQSFRRKKNPERKREVGRLNRRWKDYTREIQMKTLKVQ
jgi:hypothetical protein